MRPIHLFCAILALGCGRSVEQPPAPEAVPAALDIFPGTSNPGYVGMALGLRMRVPVVLKSKSGTEMEIPPGLTLVSRTPALVSVDSGTWITARALGGGNTLLVASVVADGRVFSDSISVGVSCTMELRIAFTPAAIDITVGQAATASVLLTGCSGQLTFADHITWTSLNPGVATVNEVSGVVTGVSAGTTTIAARGSVHGNIGGIGVTVRQP